MHEGWAIAYCNGPGCYSAVHTVLPGTCTICIVRRTRSFLQNCFSSRRPPFVWVPRYRLRTWSYFYTSKKPDSVGVWLMCSLGPRWLGSGSTHPNYTLVQFSSVSALSATCFLCIIASSTIDQQKSTFRTVPYRTAEPLYPVKAENSRLLSSSCQGQDSRHTRTCSPLFFRPPAQTKSRNGSCSLFGDNTPRDIRRNIRRWSDGLPPDGELGMGSGLSYIRP